MRIERKREMRIMKFGIVTRFEKLKIRRFIVENAVSLRIECSDGDKRVLWCFVFTLSVDSLTRLFVCCKLRDFSQLESVSKEEQHNHYHYRRILYLSYRISVWCHFRRHSSHLSSRSTCSHSYYYYYSSFLSSL